MSQKPFIDFTMPLYVPDTGHPEMIDWRRVKPRLTKYDDGDPFSLLNGYAFHVRIPAKKGGRHPYDLHLDSSFQGSIEEMFKKITRGLYEIDATPDRIDQNPLSTSSSRGYAARRGDSADLYFKLSSTIAGRLDGISAHQKIELLTRAQELSEQSNAMRSRSVRK